MAERRILPGNRRPGRARAVVGLAVAAVFSAAAAGAQQPPPPDPPDSVETQEEIVVRALRSPLALGSLPFSVTVRRPSDQPPSAALSLASVVRAVPGLQVHSRYNDALGDRIVLRGFGARTQFGVRGVHVLVDGIPATMPDGQTTLNHLDLTRVERVEVLRGPGAAAYGNAAGGVLLFETPPPPAEGSRQAVAVTAGSDGLIRLRGSGGASLGAGGGASGWTAAATREWRDGFRPHAGTDRWNLTGRFDTPLAGGHLRLLTHGVTYDADNPGSLTPAQFMEDPRQAQAFNVAQRTGEEGRHGQVGATWERLMGVARLEASLYGVARSLENPIPPTIIDLDRRAGGARVLLRGGGEQGRAAWAVGADAAVQADDRRNFENDGGAPGALTLDQGERVTDVAVHGQVVAPVLDGLALFVAGRYDRVGFRADDRMVTPDNPDDSGERAMDAVSPTAGVLLEMTPRVSLFANVSTSFETPTTTELVNRPDGQGGFNQQLEPQRTISYEAGTRARLGRGLYLEGAVFHARIEDALVPFESAAQPGRQYFRNAAGAVHNGAELLAELRTGPVDIVAAYARTAAEFSSYETGGTSYDGLEIPGVRPWTVAVSATTRPGGLVLELSYEGAGAMAVDDANTVQAPEYHLIDARIAGGELRLGRWTASPYAGVDNLLDEIWVASVVPNAFGSRFFEPGPGRSLFAGVQITRSTGPEMRR